MGHPRISTAEKLGIFYIRYVDDLFIFQKVRCKNNISFRQLGRDFQNMLLIEKGWLEISDGKIVSHTCDFRLTNRNEKDTCPVCKNDILRSKFNFDKALTCCYCRRRLLAKNNNLVRV